MVTCAKVIAVKSTGLIAFVIDGSDEQESKLVTSVVTCRNLRNANKNVCGDVEVIQLLK